MGNPVADFERSDKTLIDTRTVGVGVQTVTQTDGPTATIVESPTGLFTITWPTPFTEAMIFNLHADDGGDTADTPFTIYVPGTQTFFVYDADLDTWL